MTQQEFEQLVAQEFPGAIPEQFREKLKNVAFLIESEPSLALRAEENLADNETLLGHYRGVPHTARGDYYGINPTLPDTITLFQIPIEREAAQYNLPVAKVIQDTIWHEVAHHFGMDESAVRRREGERRKDI